MSTSTLTVRRAALRGRPGEWAIAMRDDQILAVVPEDSDLPDPAGTIDAAGRLVTPPFVDGHLHLCKVGTLDLVGGTPLAEYTGAAMGGAMTSIELAAAAKRDQTSERVLAGARRVLTESVRHGIRAVQAFVDVDPVAGLTGVDGVLAAKKEFRNLVDVQVVAFPQDGLLRTPGTEELMREAVARGVDVVGGIPWIEYTDADAAEHVRRMVGLAREHDLRVAMLVDDAGDPNLRTSEMLATALLESGMIGRGSAQHARALATYPQPTLRRALGLFRAAGLAFVTNPHTGPLHLPVTELLAAGIPVALGQDDIEDAYYPFGRHNLLEVAFLAAHLLDFRDDPALETLFDMVTIHGARALGRPSPALEPGAPADLLVLAGRTMREVLTRHEPPHHVVISGRVAATTRITTEYPGLPAQE
jgi:cytosine deaminase